MSFPQKIRKIKSGKQITASKEKLLPASAVKKRSLLPTDLQPMLATLADKPIDDAGWNYEIKWDGFRSISYLQNNEVDIRSRNNKKFNEKFYPLRRALEEWNIAAVLDGEIIVMNEKGYPDFSALQTWKRHLQA